MKILIVSMRSIHTIRWVSQLKDSGHKIFYFDILNGGYIKQWDWVEQHTDWRYKLGDFKGRYFIKKNLPRLHKYLERDVTKEFELVLQKFKPDAVHSFALFVACTPIFKVMMQNKDIKWIYSAWGNDLFYLQHKPNYKRDILEILPNIDYMFADCKRDLDLAKELGFKGKVLGDFPGGGGYHLDGIEGPIKHVSERKYIIMKGYHGEMHRGLQVLKALEMIEILPPIIIFSADKAIQEYYDNSLSLKSKDISIYSKEEPLTHKELCKLMNDSLIYIGNNLTDGMPNTLLEAICYGAFPIQSNPGGASAEIIDEGKNGLLINDCDDVYEIKDLIVKVLSNEQLLQSAYDINLEKRKQLEYSVIREKVKKKYADIELKILNNK